MIGLSAMITRGNKMLDRRCRSFLLLSVSLKSLINWCRAACNEEKSKPPGFIIHFMFEAFARPTSVI